jgi:hypothetical protein
MMEHASLEAIWARIRKRQALIRLFLKTIAKYHGRTKN